MAWAIIFLLVIGLLLLWIEFYIPGGLLGLAGGVCLFLGVILVFVEFGIFWGSVSALAVLGVSASLVGYWMRHFNRSFLGRRMVLDTEVADEPRYETMKGLIGAKGTTASPLRPSGKAVINGKKMDVVSEVGLIDSGVDVEVVNVEGINVVVRASEGA